MSRAAQLELPFVAERRARALAVLAALGVDTAPMAAEPIEYLEAFATAIVRLRPDAPAAEARS